MANETDWSLYPYHPNKAAPIAFAVIILCLGIWLIYLSFLKYHWKKFGGMMIWASSIWTAGFICRAISVRHVQNIPLFVIQYVFILMGPPLYAASEYFILGRLLAYLPYHTPIHPGRVFSTFLFLSAVVETLTGAGAGNSAANAENPTQRDVGLGLLKAALILQCFVEAFFFSLVVMLEYRCRKGKMFPTSVRTVCYVLYTTSLMMLLRCIIRAIEAFEASSCDHENGDAYCGPVSSEEWFLWVFEVANVTLFMLLLCIFHPGRYLPRSGEIFLDPVDGKTERLGPGFAKADSRAFWLTVVDPFDFWGIVSGRGLAYERFWEVEQPVYHREGKGTTSEEDNAQHSSE